MKSASMPPRPFPDAPVTPAMRREEAFLHRHSGAGPRTLHRLVGAVERLTRR